MLTPDARRELLATLPPTPGPGQRYLASIAKRLAMRRAETLGRVLQARKAQSVTCPVGFRTFVMKPVGNRCNLRCSYCFFSDHQGPGLMPKEVLARLFSEVAASHMPAAEFVWHGGEPLLAGVGFYRQVLSLQRRLLPDIRVSNVMMTNGTLVTPEWADFLQTKGFRVGVSLDGPLPVHDRNRVDAAGRGSFHRVAAGIQTLRRAGLRVGTITVYKAGNPFAPRDLVDLLFGLGVSYFRLNPALDEHQGKGYPQLVADVVRATFALGPQLRFTLLDDLMSVLLGYGPTICWMAGTCRNLVGVEPDGSLWACCERHNQEPVLRLGSITQDSLQAIWEGAANRAHCAADDRRRAACRDGCEWGFVCQGGCAYHRVLSDGDAAGRDPLCAAYAETFRLLVSMVDDCLQGARC